MSNKNVTISSFIFHSKYQTPFWSVRILFYKLNMNFIMSFLVKWFARRNKEIISVSEYRLLLFSERHHSWRLRLPLASFCVLALFIEIEDFRFNPKYLTLFNFSIASTSLIWVKFALIYKNETSQWTEIKRKIPAIKKSIV